jgi:CheY-like chemotaxis protein
MGRDHGNRYKAAFARGLMNAPTENAVILLVEDNEDDVALIRRAFARNNIGNPLKVVRNGNEAILYLQGAGRYRDRSEFPLPKLVLLDLTLPGVDGFEVISWIRAQPELRMLRVLVMTSSRTIQDVNRAYQLGANSFLVKPTDFEDLVTLTQSLRGYWICLDQAPDPQTVRDRHRTRH